MKPIALFLLILLAACTPAVAPEIVAPPIVSAATQQDLYDNSQSNRPPASAARAWAQQQDEALTATARAPITNITVTAAALVVAQTEYSMRQTSIAAAWKHTPIPTANTTP